MTWLEARGPTRPMALVRVGLALILWLTWGEHFSLYRHGSFEALAVAGAFFATTTLMLIGWRSRVSTLAAGLVGLYIYYKLGIRDGREVFVHHHTLLIVLATLLLSLAPCGDSLSLDRWLTVRRSPARGAEPAEQVGDLWAARLLALLLSVVYLGGAISKTNAGWLSGDRLEQIFTAFYAGSTYNDDASLHLLFQLMTIGVVALEWTLAFGLWVPRARRLLVPAGLLLHFSFYVLLPVESFSLTMVVLYISLAPASVDAALVQLFGLCPRLERDCNSRP